MVKRKKMMKRKRKVRRQNQREENQLREQLLREQLKELQKEHHRKGIKRLRLAEVVYQHFTQILTCSIVRTETVCLDISLCRLIRLQFCCPLSCEREIS